MSMKKIVIYLLFPVVLGSCSIYRNYERSEVPGVDSLYRASGVPQDTVSLAVLSWKELFTDQRLQALIERGLEYNTDLRVARLRVEEAKAALSAARLSYLPSLSLTPEGAVSRYDGKSTKTYNLGASAGWEIDIFGKLTNAKREARAALEGSLAYEQAVQTQVVATVADSYYTLLMLDRQVEINKQTLESWNRTIGTLEALKRAGVSDDIAVLQARANRMSLETSLLSLEKSVSEMENALSVLLAMPPQEIVRGSFDGQRFPERLSTGLPVQLLSNRPDVRQAEQALAQAFYVTNAARAAFYPSISLSGGVGWTNSGGGAIRNPGEWLLSAVGSLTQPLFNRGVNRANLKIAKAQQEEALLTFQQTVLEAGQEVNDALTQWQTARQRLDIDAQQIVTLREAVRKTELLMRHSSTNYLEVLTAQQSLLNAELVEAQDRYDEIQGVINLYHALGGGCK